MSNLIGNSAPVMLLLKVVNLTPALLHNRGAAGFSVFIGGELCYVSLVLQFQTL